MTKRFQYPIITQYLLERVIAGVPTRTHGIHGLEHWIRVERNGLYLAQHEGADPLVVSLFALFHDSRRINDWIDPGHGARGAELAEALHAEGVFTATADQMEKLLYACCGHTDETHAVDLTIGTCWDADRLDLTRLEIRPDAKCLNTDIACRIASSYDYEDLEAFQWSDGQE